MIIIGNKKLRETNKNFRALIIKLHKIIVRKDAEIKELKNILANVQDEIDDALYRELAGMENDLESTYCEEEIDMNMDVVKLYAAKLRDRLNDLFIDIERSDK